MAMEHDRYAVIKVKESAPEEFWIIWTNSQDTTNFIMRTEQGLTESALRTELGEMGHTEAKSQCSD